MSEFNEISDPSIISKLAEELEAPKQAEIKTIAPSSGDVILPGGFIDKEGAVIKYAQVRELNGLDEEAISKAGSLAKALSVILQKGVVSIGLNSASRDDIDNLLSGDREALLLGIRRATFGDTAEYDFKCPHCKTELEVAVDLVKDVPVKSLEDPISDRLFTYTSKKHGVIEISLPTGAVQKRIIENFEKTSAELNTILLAGCIKSINGEPAIGATSALNLGMIDRENIINEILKRNPGPRLGEVTATCEACGEVIPMPLSLADLFRL